MWLLIKTAWRNLFRQSRRTSITVSAMSISLILAIPSIGMMEGLKRDMNRGITGMELGHFQVHDPAYPRGRALQSTLRRADALLATLRATQGVKAASARVHGFALASHDQQVKISLVVAAAADEPQAKAIRFGRRINAQAPWRKDRALACEVLVSRHALERHSLNVGTVLTPEASGKEGRCERLKVVGIFAASSAAEGTSPKEALKLFMPAEDIQAFAPEGKGATGVMRALIRHSTALSLYGVDPRHEPDVSFMSEKVVQGRYLGKKAKGELVVGYRLAKTLKLKVGSKLFVQAGALDQTQGSFYRDFSVVGIYRTGVDFIDRSRVFLHIADAQAVMTLGERIHEVALIAADATHLRALHERLKTRVHSELVVLTRQGKKGTRAGSEPLPAPLTVYEPRGGDAKLLIPYDLKRRFEDIKGLEAVARRIYGNATLVKGGAEHALRFVGVEPAYEGRLSGLDKKLSAGSFLPNNTPDEVWPLLLSERAATALSAKVGDALVLRAKDEDGARVDIPIKVQGIIASSQW
ncbi:MAG: ABC transporter permease, partial [Deltaproteobacteria bacterium]|nr:ABC transporter permease [Deltaproteobacteria bacterium]